MRAMIVGSSGGIGAAFADELVAQGGDVVRLSRSQNRLDVTDEISLERAFSKLEGTFDLVFVASGALVSTRERPEKSIRELTVEELAEQHRINAIGPIMVLKHAMPFLPRDRRAVFAALSARVGSIGDNRLGGWHSYRASKAALNQLLHGAAIELQRTHRQAIVVALHPGTVATKFTEAYADSHERVSPDTAARNLLDVMQRLEPSQTGGFYDYSGKPIPW